MVYASFCLRERNLGDLPRRVDSGNRADTCRDEVRHDVFSGLPDRSLGPDDLRGGPDLAPGELAIPSPHRFEWPGTAGACHLRPLAGAVLAGADLSKHRFQTAIPADHPQPGKLGWEMSDRSTEPGDEVICQS